MWLQEQVREVAIVIPPAGDALSHNREVFLLTLSTTSM